MRAHGEPSQRKCCQQRDLMVPFVSAGFHGAENKLASATPKRADLSWALFHFVKALSQRALNLASVCNTGLMGIHP